MSLKAKLEAVIYAAEEPVTLAQLAVLFAADALEWKAEQQAARAEAQADAEANPAEAAAATLPLLDGEAGPAAEAGGPLEIPIEIPILENAEAESPAPPSDPNPVLDFGPDLDPGAEPASEDGAGSESNLPAGLRDREVRAILRQLLDELIASCASDSRGVEIREIAGGYRMATKPECHDAVRSFVKSLKPALKLSLPALETLAVIAYKQPVTAPEVNEIRGVDSSGVFGSLLARKLIATAGRKPVIGRPILYKTTREFLLRFGLKDVSELPSMEEFEKMAAIELEEPAGEEEEPLAPEDTAPAIAADLSLELRPDLSPEAAHSGDGESAGAPESAPNPDLPAAEAASTTTETAPGGAE